MCWNSLVDIPMWKTQVLPSFSHHGGNAFDGNVSTYWIAKCDPVPGSLAPTIWGDGLRFDGCEPEQVGKPSRFWKDIASNGVIKHVLIEKSPMNGGFYGKITYKWRFYIGTSFISMVDFPACHVWVAQGMLESWVNCWKIFRNELIRDTSSFWEKHNRIHGFHNRKTCGIKPHSWRVPFFGVHGSWGFSTSTSKFRVWWNSIYISI